ncbi:hypothetical protein RFI_08851 [Reticulomyxa filosa]|uniref:Uncharacterized protein n=1 Tax=Reticulomyxa filosa TaxID=46433 RepID=X6NRC5_RETFI|nr:hypothetical protein RFI_08851 [Reticulomyxa filosa]|eukprot:ETO28279.1 hypothetical protein RFI_08851 [Reticulomyxa filosa]
MTVFAKLNFKHLKIKILIMKGKQLCGNVQSKVFFVISILHKSFDAISEAEALPLDNDKKADSAMYLIDARYAYCRSSPGDTICCLLNLFEAILFGLFTCIMSCDQISSIWNNTTYIDIIQNRGKSSKEKKSAYESFQLVFGEPFNITWFLPTPVTARMLREFKYLCSKMNEDN